MTRYWSAVVVAALLLVVGCGSNNNVVLSTPNIPSGETASTPLRCATPTTPPDIECYSKAQMQQFLDRAIRLVASYFDEVYGTSLPHPSKFIYIPTGQSAATACTGGVPNDKSYFYCPADKQITAGQETIWSFYTKFGAAGPIVAYAHEWGHHLQNIARVPDPSTNAQSVAHENQADCIAGAWTQWADNKKMIEYPKDLQNVVGLLTAVGSVEGGDHGTASQREQSFSSGFGDGIYGCNKFYPNTPIASRP